MTGRPRFTRRALVAGLLVLGLVAGHGSRAQTGASASGVVERLHAVLAEHLAARDLTFDRRLERLRPLVSESFDLDAITRVALGSAWADLDEAARGRFTRLMHRLSAITYAARFDASDDPVRFVTVSSEPARRGQVLVRTRLERPSDTPVSLDYMLVESAQGPRIVNVLANGVSDLSLKRAEYAAVIRREGVDGLEKRLEEQVNSLAVQARAAETGS